MYDSSLLQELAFDLRDWLQSVGTDEIFEYAKNLEARKPGIISEVEPDLLSRVRIARSDIYNKNFSSNAPAILSESEIMFLTASFTQFNADSVAKNFTGRFADLKLTPPADAQSLARSVITLFSNTYYFLTAIPAANQASYLFAVLEQDPGQNAVENMLIQCQDLISKSLSDIYVDLEKDQPLPAQLQPGFRDLLTFVSQDAPEKIEKVTTSGNYEANFAILSNIERALQIAALYYAKKEMIADITDKKSLFLIAWSMAQQEKEEQVTLEKDAQKDQERFEKNLHVEDPEYLEPAERFLTVLYRSFNLPALGSGDALETISEYCDKLGPEERIALIDLYEPFFKDSLIIETVFPGMDPQYFLDEVHAAVKKGTQAELRQSLSLITSAEWTDAAQAILEITLLMYTLAESF